MSTLKSDYHYHLPEVQIAQHPVNPRDSSRLMLLDRKTGAIDHHHFYNFSDFLEPGSLLIVNNSKVIPARLPGTRKSGGSLEVLLVNQLDGNIWTCKIKNASRLKMEEVITLCDGNLSAKFLGKQDGSEYLIQFLDDIDLLKSLESFGYAPLPPYIHKVREEESKREQDLSDYQTVYAASYGSIAAPTAGFHFTPKILDQIKQKDIEIAEVTLHVGLGTFEPIRVDDVKDHTMHEERYTIDEGVANKVMAAKKEKRKVVAVGTTTIRTLESAWSENELKSGTRSTNLFIHPPYQYKVADQMLTNFHLPESTLLMLVSAFAGKEHILNAYNEAVLEGYRFFSYGDCMFIR